MAEQDPSLSGLSVIFVAGAARSGSTLLGEVLGAQPGVFNMGEAALLWRDAARGNRCACGEPLADCEVWGAALDALATSHGVRAEEWAQLAATRAAVARTRRLPALLRLLHQPSLRPPEVRRLLEVTTALYDHAARAAGAACIVDTSKTLPALLFHQMTGHRTSVVHLMRDARAVAASTSRSRGTVRGNEDSLPPGGGLAAATTRWLWANTSSAVGIRRWHDGPHIRLWYETLFPDPAARIADLCAQLALGYDESTLVDNELRLPRASHAGVGNPRRGSRVVPLRLDQRWQTELGGVQSRLVRAATAPMAALLR